MTQIVTKKKGTKIYFPLVTVILMVTIGSWYWYKDYSRYISTDDAKIESDNVSISSKILGRIVKLHAEEGDTIRKNTLLVELDSTDLIAQRAQAMASLEQANALVGQSRAKLKYDSENIKIVEVALNKAREDYDRANAQIAGDVITKEQFDHAKKAFESAKAQLDAAKSQLAVTNSQIESANAAVGFANAQINVINTQLTNTRLYAPFDGVIARRWLLAGDIAQAGQTVLSLTGHSDRWVIIFLEETKLADIHLNQEAKFTIDAFGEQEFSGKIYSIGASTAAQFSLIPSNNASGNFTKVTQRVPIKISIDRASGGQDVKKMNIIPGMSVVVKVIKDQK